MTDLNALAKECYEIAKSKGFYSPAPTLDQRFMLIVTELAEAYEEHRDGRKVTEIYFNPDKPNKPEGIPIELADAIIRILDFCGHSGIDIVSAIQIKMEYNKTRPHKHGRAF